MGARRTRIDRDGLLETGARASEVTLFERQHPQVLERDAASGLTVSTRSKVRRACSRRPACA